MVEAFADLFERSRVQFTNSYDMSTALNSMQGLSSNAPSTRRLMTLVTKALSTVTGNNNSVPFSAITQLYAYVRHQLT